MPPKADELFSYKLCKTFNFGLVFFFYRSFFIFFYFVAPFVLQALAHRDKYNA